MSIKMVLIAIQKLLTEPNNDDAAQHDGVVVLEAVAACAVLASVLGMHMWVQPYQYRYQNRLEVALSTTNLVFVALLCVLNSGGCDGEGTDSHELSVYLGLVAIS